MLLVVMQSTPQDLRVAVGHVFDMAFGESIDRQTADKFVTIDLDRSALVSEFTVSDSRDNFDVPATKAIVVLMQKMADDFPVFDDAQFEENRDNNTVRVIVPVDENLAAAYNATRNQRTRHAVE